MNICRFVPAYSSPDVITTLNFVCERGEFVNKGPFIFSFYRICLVTKGKCTVKFDRTRFEVKENDVFVIFPSVEYTLECGDDLNLMYVSFIGTRVSEIMTRLGITKKCCFFNEMSHIRFFWEQEFSCRNEFLDLVSESVILYTFSEIGHKVSAEKEDDETVKASGSMLFVKKFIDENFGDPNISLESVSNRFQYNKKYLSHHFKRVFGMGVSEYLNTLRISYAVSLIDQRHLFVQEIAFRCGYKDPFYFSRVFKKIIGISPKEMIKMKNK